MIRVSVIDNGPGIPPHEQSRIFAQFTRIEGSGASGTGLGLSISRTLARRLGGDLTLASEPGKGSVFSLTLPLRRRFEARPPSLNDPTRRYSPSGLAPRQ
jgi:signal transduction histidine kinase